MKILVADDLPGNRVLLKHILEASGFENVIMAESADEAFEILGMTQGEREADNDFLNRCKRMPQQQVGIDSDGFGDE